jgi:tetratricopeptide (TPR) repeat protein
MGSRLDSVLVVDFRRSFDGIPEEVASLLPLFDGTRTARDALRRARVPDAHASALVERLRRLGVVREPSAADEADGPDLAEWLGRRHTPRRWWLAVAALPIVAGITFLVLRPRPLPATSAAALAPPPAMIPAPIAPPAPAVVPPPPVVVVPPPVVVAPPPPAVAPPAPAAEDDYPRLIKDARALLDRGAYGKALAAANKAAQARPDAADPYLVIGTVEQQNGRVAQATAAYKRYLALAPKGAYASEIRAILRTLH